MNELQVNVIQTPGQIQWNFEELKKNLSESMEVYKNTVYTDETIGEAKKDVAALRKLSKAVNDRKIEIKKKCLEPFTVIEAQAKELIAMIDEPIAMIGKNVDKYETERRAKRRAKILEEMNASLSDIPEDVRKVVIEKWYDPKWENATATYKEYREKISSMNVRENGGVGWDAYPTALRLTNWLSIYAYLEREIDEDFREDVMKVYKNTLDITRAMLEAQKLQNQKQKLLERERERKAMAAAEAHAVAKAEAPDDPKPAPAQTPAPATASTRPVCSKPENSGAEDPVSTYTLSIRATKAQYEKIKGYIAFVGAAYEAKE